MNKLIVVGSGIKSVSHISKETQRIIQDVDKVLYLVSEPLMKAWIEQKSTSAESLEPIYYNFEKRVDAYHAISNYIVEQHLKIKLLCVIFYGHPTVFADSALNAVQRINNMDGDAIILPAISAMDCLFSDLKLDPGKSGCFSIEATELLIFERHIDNNSHFLIWQAANLGAHDGLQTTKIGVLCDYLLEYYPSKHPVCIYEASQLPTIKHRADWIKLDELSNADITPISTLYFPPIQNKILSQKYLKLLEIDLENFKLSSQPDTPSK